MADNTRINTQLNYVWRFILISFSSMQSWSNKNFFNHILRDIIPVRHFKIHQYAEENPISLWYKFTEIWIDDVVFNLYKTEWNLEKFYSIAMITNAGFIPAPPLSTVKSRVKGNLEKLKLSFLGNNSLNSNSSSKMTEFWKTIPKLKISGVFPKRKTCKRCAPFKVSITRKFNQKSVTADTFDRTCVTLAYRDFTMVIPKLALTLSGRTFNAIYRNSDEAHAFCSSLSFQQALWRLYVK